MRISKLFSKKARALLACLLSLLMLASLCLTVSAAKIEGEETLLTLDPTQMTSLSGSDSNFSWKGGSSAFALTQVTTDTYSGKVLSCTPGEYWIYDTNKILPTYEAVSLGFDIYFDEFPSGLNAAGDRTCDKSLVTDGVAFYSKAILCWPTSSYNGIRIDSEGNLYTASAITSAIGVQLAEKTWYNLEIVYSKLSNNAELWINGECATTLKDVSFGTEANTGFRFFDGAFTYTSYLKNIELSVSEIPYQTGVSKESSSDFISYQTTKADGGLFDLRIVAGVNSLAHKSFGYEVVKLTKDNSGSTVVTEYAGANTKAYSSIYGGGTQHSVHELFGYQYACLATLKDLDASSKFTELVIYPYTVSETGNKLYGTPISLTYTGSTDADGYPTLERNDTVSTTLTPTDDTYIYYSKSTANGDVSNTPYGSASTLVTRNPKNESENLYRAAYFMFELDSKTAARLDSMQSAFFHVNVSGYGGDTTREIRPLVLFAADTGWTEETLTYNNHTAGAARGAEIARIDDSAITENDDPDRLCDGYIAFDILDYLKSLTVTEGKSLKVAFCITQADYTFSSAWDELRYDSTKHTRSLNLYSKEYSKATQPYISLSESLYGHTVTNVKVENYGYEPLSRAETLVDNWFNSLYDEIYKEPHGTANSFAPNGYAATTATAPFSQPVDWKDGTVWYKQPTTNVKSEFLSTAAWSTSRFARTLSTLNQTAANANLTTNATEYKGTYGGITNMGITGTATGYFHTETLGGRTYIIDPEGYPYFATGVNELSNGRTQNQKNYSAAKYENFYTDISAELKEIGVNTAFVSASDSLLAVKDSLAVTISAVGIDAYMESLGLGEVSEGLFGNNDTINVFDPDLAPFLNVKNRTLIESKGYTTNPYVFGYTADNELPSGSNSLERYMTIDPTSPHNAFSYHTAWEFFAKWLEVRKSVSNPNPTLQDLQNLPAADYAAINSEFLSFVYATYYEAVSTSIKDVDKNHMYLGSRVNGACLYDEGYLRAAGKYLDVLTLNLYGGLNPAPSTLSNIYYYSGKPFIVTEFFAKAMDAIDASGYKLANSTGAGILVNTQAERAAYYEHYVLNLLQTDTCVGWVWYCFRDNDQSLYTATDGTNTYKNVRFLYTPYGANPSAKSFMLMDETAKWASGYTFTKTYDGEGLHSNQNVNKGFYNSDYSSVVTVYSYNSDGTLDTTTDPLNFGSKSYKVKDPDSVNATTLTSLDGTTTYTIGKATTSTGYTITKLTVYKGRYVEFTDAVANISQNLANIVKYFNAN